MKGSVKSSHLHKHSSSSPSCANLYRTVRKQSITHTHGHRSQTALNHSHRTHFFASEYNFFFFFFFCVWISPPLTAFTPRVTPYCEAGGYSCACALHCGAELKSAILRRAGGTDRILISLWFHYKQGCYKNCIQKEIQCLCVWGLFQTSRRYTWDCWKPRMTN